MGSSCSSAQKKDKERQTSQSGQSPIGGRRRSTDSLPYGKGSPPSSRRPSFDPNSAPAPVVEQAESPSDSTVPKTPVDSALSQASVGGGSSSSPPPSGTLGTPVVKDAPPLDAGLPDLQKFPEQVRSLLLGKVADSEFLPPLQEITLYICADFYDSAVERDSLHERVFPTLRRYTAERGYELNVADLHWGVPGVCIVDHNLRDLCIDILERWRTRRRVLTLVLFNDNIGTVLLPRDLPKPHFEAGIDAMETEEDKELFRKWYQLDQNASPQVFVLQPITTHFPDVSSEDPEKRKESMDEWKEEAQKMITILRRVLPDGQKNKYLTSVLQDEIKLIVTDDPQEAKRSLWMQRRFTHKPPASGDGPAPDTRRIDQTKIQLEDYLPDTQKLVFYVKWHEEGLDPVSVGEHERYLNDVCEALKEELKKMIDCLLEEDFLEEAQQPYRGIETPLYVELTQQYRACHQLSSGFKGRDATLQAVKDYLQGPSIHPLIVHGPPGCGKTALVAKATEQSPDWLNSAPVVTRLVGITAESATQEQLLRSISEQCCALYGEHPSLASESFQGWGSGLGKLLERVSELRPLVVMIDGLDQVATYSSKDLQWLPSELPAYVKLLLTVRNESEELEKMKNLLQDDECFLPMEQPSASEAVATVDEVLQKCKRHLTEGQREVVETCVQQDSSARYSQLLSQIVLRWPSGLQPESIKIKKTTEGLILQHLALVESYMGASLVTFILGLLLAAKHGLSESEIVDILSCDETILDLVFNNVEPQVRRFPSVLWVFMKKWLQPLLWTSVLGGRTLTTLSCEAYRTIVKKYLQQKNHHSGNDSAQVLVDYFFGKWAEGRKKPTSKDENEENGKNRLVLDQPLAYGPNPNRRKLEELPFQVLNTEDCIRDNFLFDATWLLYKFCGSDPYQLLEDVSIYEGTRTDKEQIDHELKLLSSVVQLSSYALRCDGSQFFAQMYGRLKTFLSNTNNVDRYPAIKTIFDTATRPPLSSLLPLSSCLREPSIDNCQVGSESTNDVTITVSSMHSPFSGLYTIKEDKAHVISLAPERGEIVVWNIYEQAPVRKLVNISQPKDIKMIDQHRALVLCNRELKVYHLDQGTMLVKLKGVMNQKMAYYGLHDENYVVALSRNRMYVNMMNLTTGDLETTFKVGEDRFLNSLLVSANGRICVCGDETQKPFPLLVWDLTSRKLVYDLRIPHHEFITRLSAISDDGHYVVSVCRELHDTSPNFIIVYDLQSGTLFKKWKPESNSCSIAISSQGGCVVNGLENTWVLVWDLSTGARRYTLRGHSAPIDQIRMEEEGCRCLTYDSKGRDRSLRVWDVAKGLYANNIVLQLSTDEHYDATYHLVIKEMLSVCLLRRYVPQRHVRGQLYHPGECLAVFTPDQDFTCCELSLDGKAVVLGLKGQDKITTLLLCRESSMEEELPPSSCYGDVQRKNKVFDMSHDGQ